MATMGAPYGTLVGGILAATSSILAGLVGLELGRLVGRTVVRLLANEADLARLQGSFDSWGAHGIVASRALPVAPGVLTVLAGIARMHVGRFVLELVVGGLLSASCWLGPARTRDSLPGCCWSRRWSPPVCGAPILRSWQEALADTPIAESNKLLVQVGTHFCPLLLNEGDLLVPPHLHVRL
jgi:hypothetical protein